MKISRKSGYTFILVNIAEHKFYDDILSPQTSRYVIKKYVLTKKSFKNTP